VLAVRLVRETTSRRAGVLFHYSLLYLALLYLAMAGDALL
jgi:heme O synthase-like polyprenyltransferase